MKRVGILGGGQLGTMLAEAIHQLGADTVFLDPDPDAPAKRRFADVITASFTDAAAVAELASRADVVTYEFENVDTDALATLSGDVPIVPDLSVLAVTQDRIFEKDRATRAGLPVARYAVARGVSEIAAAARAIGFPCIVKTARGGYDGKGQFRLNSASDVDAAKSALAAFGGDEVPCVVEEVVDIALEVSAIVARSERGEEIVFPTFENEHAKHILDVTVIPARVPPDLAKKAQEIGLRAARELGVVGLLTTEMFVAKRDGALAILVNEFAPRPHNSGHVTRKACTLSQFDALARVLLDLPLHPPEMISRDAFCMGNVLGDLWAEREGEPDWSAWARHPEVLDIVLYGKREARVGRKMGHFTVRADDAARAVELAKAFRRDISRRS